MRVLLVDDEVRLADGVRRGLEAEGMTVDVAHDGVDGLWRAREFTYDVVLLDVMMPGMSGYRVCQTMRAEGIWTPVLFLTAKDGEWDEVEGLDTGGDDWLTKPFSFPVLVARIRALVRRGGRERPAVLEAGDLALDPAARTVHRGQTEIELTARTVHRGQTEIELTAREMAVLELLLRRKGEVVTKTQVLDDVWHEDFDGDPNIVEVYVGRIRRKVDRPFGRDAIRTVRGAGYRLAADGG